MKIVRFDDLNSRASKTDTLAEPQLSIDKRRAARVSLKKDAAGGIAIQVDGQSMSIDAGFVPRRLLFQIFCAKGWVQFADAAAPANPWLTTRQAASVTAAGRRVRRDGRPRACV